LHTIYSHEDGQRLQATLSGGGCGVSRAAVSNGNCLPNQKLCQYLNQGRTLNDLL